MFTFDIDETSDKQVLYKDLVQAADALTEGEPDAIANMANLSSLIWQYLPDLNWAGFYRMIDGELVQVLRLVRARRDAVDIEVEKPRSAVAEEQRLVEAQVLQARLLPRLAQGHGGSLALGFGMTAEL